ncbi:MAG: HAMP domain-containing histidine kinase, partial [Muribaculaceae bacterium]|nr:HAMP domain-containing histidine kinase [Muribaculaceae bacterium]
FVDMIKIDNAAKASSYTELAENLSRLIREYKSDSSPSLYSRAEILYSLCCHLRYVSRGTVLTEYYEKLDSLLRLMPLNTGAVRNLVYTRSAPIFTANGDYRHAIAIDRRLLNVVDSLETIYHSRGRRFRNFNTIRYTTLTRMLSNYRGLSQPEIEAFYHQVNNMATTDSLIAADLKNTKRAHIFYNLATGRDRQAVAMIRSQLPRLPQSTLRTYLLTALVDASLRLGDRATAGEAALELNSLLRDQIKSHSEEQYRELQVLYDVRELAAEREELLRTRHRSEMFYSYLVAGIVFLLLIAVGAVLAIYISRNRRIKAISQQLRESAERLTQERNQLRSTQQELIVMRDQAKAADKLKTDFIHNMSHEVQTPLAAIVEYSRLIVDCCPDDKSSYLNRFADIIDLNTRLILTLVNDVLDVAALERNKMSLNKKPESVYDICNFALDDIFEKRRSRNPDVNVVFNPSGRPDLHIVTDGTRVAQVLINLLGNAEKFTEKGTVTLDFRPDPEKGTISFIVTDTGIGIPAGKEKVIFSCFRQLDQTTSGCGLGLYVSHLITELLGGTLEVDTTYRSGARFIFTIPA